MARFCPFLKYVHTWIAILVPITPKKESSKVIFSMSSEFDVTNLYLWDQKLLLFSKKVQNWGLRPTSWDEYIQYEAVLV